MSGISLPRRQQLQVVITFLLLLALFNGISQIEQRYSGQYIDIPYTSLVTTGAAYVGNLFMPFTIGKREPVTLSAGDGVAVVVRGGCNGIEAVFLLLAGGLAFPVGWVNPTTRSARRSWSCSSCCCGSTLYANRPPG